MKKKLGMEFKIFLHPIILYPSLYCLWPFGSSLMGISTHWESPWNPMYLPCQVANSLWGGAQGMPGQGQAHSRCSLHATLPRQLAKGPASTEAPSPPACCLPALQGEGPLCTCRMLKEVVLTSRQGQPVPPPRNAMSQGAILFANNFIILNIRRYFDCKNFTLMMGDICI